MTPAEKAEAARSSKAMPKPVRQAPLNMTFAEPSVAVRAREERVTTQRRDALLEDEQRRRGALTGLLVIVLGLLGFVLLRTQLKSPEAQVTPVAIAPQPPAPAADAPSRAYSASDDSPYHQEALKLAAEQRIKAKLKDPTSARFSGLQIGDYAGHVVVCGYVNSRNSFNGYSGDQRFAVGGMVLLEEDAAEGAMSEIWANSGCK